MTGVLPGPVDADLDALFATGVDELPGDEVDGQKLGLPNIDDVRAYRQKVFARVVDLVDGVDGPISPTSRWWALAMACEHQRVHIDTSSVPLGQLAVGDVARPEGLVDAPAGGDAPPPAWASVPEGAVRLGKRRGDVTFGWDIEYGERVVTVPAFRAARMLVTNADFAGFVDEGGYRRSELWSPAGWTWRGRAGATHPRFW